MREDDVEIRDFSTPFQGFFKVDRVTLRYRRYDQTWSRPIIREIFTRGRSVALLPYDPVRDEVVLIEQFRAAARLAKVAGQNGWLIETIAGMIEPGETSEQVARREAAEEAGLELTGPLLGVGGYFTSPGGSDEWVDIFIGRCDSSTAGGVHGLASEGEDIKVLVLPFAQAMSALAAGEIPSGPAQIALYWLMAHRDGLCNV